MKISGREAGRYCVVIKKINDSFVEITGPKSLTGIKRRKCNIRHLEELPYKIEINENASDEEIISKLEKENLIKKLNLKK